MLTSRAESAAAGAGAGASPTPGRSPDADLEGALPADDAPAAPEISDEDIPF